MHVSRATSFSVAAAKAGFATGQTDAYAGPARPQADGLLVIVGSNPGAITGRVVDESGEPIDGATVWSYAFTNAFGLRQFGMLAAAGESRVTTDADGYFRVED